MISIEEKTLEQKKQEFTNTIFQIGDKVCLIYYTTREILSMMPKVFELRNNVFEESNKGKETIQN